MLYHSSDSHKLDTVTEPMNRRKQAVQFCTQIFKEPSNKPSNVFHTKLPQEKQGGQIGAVFRMGDGHWESSLKSYVVKHLHKLKGKEVSKP